MEVLVKKLKEGDKSVREKAAYELGNFGKEAVGYLIEALEDRDKEVRQSAASALGRIGDRRAVEPLIQALKAGWAELEIVKALGRIGDPRAVEPLIDVLLYEADYVSQTCAAAALGDIGDSRAVEALKEALNNDENEDVRRAAESSLARIKRENN